MRDGCVIQADPKMHIPQEVTAEAQKTRLESDAVKISQEGTKAVKEKAITIDVANNTKIVNKPVQVVVVKDEDADDDDMYEPPAYFKRLPRTTSTAAWSYVPNVYKGGQSSTEITLPDDAGVTKVGCTSKSIYDPMDEDTDDLPESEPETENVCKEINQIDKGKGKLEDSV